MTLLHYEAKYTPSVSIKSSHVPYELKNDICSFCSFSDMRGGKIFKGNRKFQHLQCNFKSRKSRRGLKADDPADQIAVNLQQLYLIYCVICQLRFPGINEELDQSIPHPLPSLMYPQILMYMKCERLWAKSSPNAVIPCANFAHLYRGLICLM